MILNNTTNISTAIIDKISINVTAILNNTALVPVKEVRILKLLRTLRNLFSSKEENILK